MLKSFIKACLKLFNYVLIKKSSLDNLYRLSRQNNLDIGNTMIDTMYRLKAIGINPFLILDIGAAKGKWTEKAKLLWPDSSFLLIEPLKEQINLIPQNLKYSTGMTIIEAVAGRDPGVISFNVSSDLDGSGVYGTVENARILPVISLDDHVSPSGRSVLIKLDTHGYEIPIFEGAIQTLKRTEAIIVEVYGFKVSPTALLFHEISDYLFKQDFRLFDIADILRRDSDKAFWQADAVYLKKSNPIFASNKYKE